jgi:hypothetical protein
MTPQATQVGETAFRRFGSAESKEMKMAEKSRNDRNDEPQSTAATHLEQASGLPQGARSIEEIRVRAYELFMERGGEPGHDLEDWRQAEREVESRSDADADFITSARRNDD